jgi:hypothetical protein
MVYRIFLVGVLAASMACGGESDDTGSTGGTVVIGAGGTAGEGGAGGAGGGVGSRVEIRERLSFIKQVNDDSGARSDLFIYDFDLDDEINLTEGTDDVDCGTRSCKLSDRQTSVGWLARQPNGSFNLRVAPVDLVANRIDLSAVVDVATGVDQFDFTIDDSTMPAQELVVYSRVQSDGSGRKEIIVRPVTTCTDCEVVLGSVNADGGYRVTQYSGLFILVETTLSSMTVKLFNLGTMSQQNIASFGVENMTGSQFSAMDPIGLAPSAEYLSIFTRDNFLWKLNNIEARPDAPEPQIHELFETSTSRSGTCMRMGDYFFQEVRKDPVFSNDSEWIYFLVTGTCNRTASDAPTNRDDYDVLRMNRNLSGMVENVTQIFHGSDWSNHDISNFAVNGEGTRLLVDGQRPTNALSKSLWLIDPSSGEYDCSRGTERRGIDGKTRCEFIFDERTDVEVRYRDVRFHTVEVSR